VDETAAEVRASSRKPDDLPACCREPVSRMEADGKGERGGDRQPSLNLHGWPQVYRLDNG
jgi:hypothetical protein